MRISRLMVVLAGFGAIVALGLTALPWTLGAGSSEAEQGGAMYNCPQAGRWAISVWDGPDGTDTGQALAACGQEAIDVAYYIDPDTQQWLRYFAGHAEISTLPMLNDKQGIIVRGSTPVTSGALAIPGATYAGTTSQGLSIEFQVSADGLTIAQVTYRASGTKPEGGTCESLSTSTLGPSTVGTSIVDNSFSIAHTLFDMSGHFETQWQATGELTVHEPQADLVPPCNAGPMTWTASIPSPTPTAPGQMHNCPKAGKWAISVWDGPDGTETGQALATCGAGAVAAAYYLDPQTGGWSRWFAGQPGMSTLSTLNNMQGVLALGAVGAPLPTPTPTPTPTVTLSPTPSPTPVATAVITGTAIPTMTQADVVAGGKTIIITLTNDTWVAAGAIFNAQRQNIINGLDSAQSEAHGWDVEVKGKIAVTDVARTSDTVATITLDAEAAYYATATETITATVPASALMGGIARVATPTFAVTGITSDDQVDVSSDDAQEYENTGAVELTGGDVFVMSSPNANARYWAGLRFHNGPFPEKGSLVLTAYFNAYIFGTGNANLDIYAEDAQAPATFTTDAFNVSGRTPTSASVPWVADGLPLLAWSQSPSIVSVIQELVDSYDPTAITLILKPRTDVYKYLAGPGAWDYPGHVLGAVLHLEWVVPTAAGHIKTVSSVAWANVSKVSGVAEATTIATGTSQEPYIVTPSSATPDALSTGSVAPLTSAWVAMTARWFVLVQQMPGPVRIP